MDVERIIADASGATLGYIMGNIPGAVEGAQIADRLVTWRRKRSRASEEPNTRPTKRMTLAPVPTIENGSGNTLSLFDYTTNNSSMPYRTRKFKAKRGGSRKMRYKKKYKAKYKAKYSKAKKTLYKGKKAHVGKKFYRSFNAAMNATMPYGHCIIQNATDARHSINTQGVCTVDWKRLDEIQEAGNKLFPNQIPAGVNQDFNIILESASLHLTLRNGTQIPMIVDMYECTPAVKQLLATDGFVDNWNSALLQTSVAAGPHMSRMSELLPMMQ